MSQNIQNKITYFFTCVASSKCLDSTSTSYNNDIESYNNFINLKRKHEDVDQLESDTIQNNVSIYYTVHTHVNFLIHCECCFYACYLFKLECAVNVVPSVPKNDIGMFIGRNLSDIEKHIVSIS